MVAMQAHLSPLWPKVMNRPKVLSTKNILHTWSQKFLVWISLAGFVRTRQPALGRPGRALAECVTAAPVNITIPAESKRHLNRQISRCSMQSIQSVRWNHFAIPNTISSQVLVTHSAFPLTSSPQCWGLQSLLARLTRTEWCLTVCRGN